MVLEAIMLCVDNSEWSRNGDYAPSRFDSQQDAALILCQAKTQINPENTLGVMAYSGKRVDVKITQTNDEGLLMDAINSIEIKGECDIVKAIKVASLSLKHRQNKNQRQRIIIFVGHPLKEDDNETVFEELGMQLKRSSIAIDVINFAHPENIPKLQVLVNTANTSGNCHFLDVPLGVQMITDLLISSPIINDDDGAGGAGIGGAPAQPGGAGAASQFQEFGGVDPNLDPELAMALRISLEEEKARQNVVSDGGADQRQEQSQQNAQDSGAQQMEGVIGGEDEEYDEEALLEQARLLSLEGAAAAQQEKKNESAQDNYQELLDNDFVGQIVKDLNLNVNEQDIQQLMGEMGKDKKEDKDKKDNEETKK